MRHSVTRSRPQGWITLRVLTASLLLHPTGSRAQSTNDDLKVDAQQARANASAAIAWGTTVSSAAFVEPTREGAAPQNKYTFYFLLPVLYNSNAEAANNGGTGAAELTPEVRFGWARPLSGLPVKLSAFLDASSDRYPGAGDANGDTLLGKIRAQYVTGGDDQEFEPFFEYAPRLNFDPAWKERKVTIQDVTLGFDKAINFESDFTRIKRPKIDSSLECAWSFGFTGVVKRRFSDSAPDSWIATGAPSFTWNRLNPDPKAAQWNASLELDVTRKLSDSQGGVSRRDAIFNPIVTVEFLPPLRWFDGTNNLERDNRRTSLGRPRIEFQLAFTNGNSNVSGKGFHQWVVGPSLKTSWKF